MPNPISAHRLLGACARAMGVRIHAVIAQWIITRPSRTVTKARLTPRAVTRNSLAACCQGSRPGSVTPTLRPSALSSRTPEPLGAGARESPAVLGRHGVHGSVRAPAPYAPRPESSGASDCPVHRLNGASAHASREVECVGPRASAHVRRSLPWWQVRTSSEDGWTRRASLAPRADPMTRRCVGRRWDRGRRSALARLVATLAGELLPRVHRATDRALHGAVPNQDLEDQLPLHRRLEEHASVRLTGTMPRGCAALFW